MYECAVPNDYFHGYGSRDRVVIFSDDILEFIKKNNFQVKMNDTNSIYTPISLKEAYDRFRFTSSGPYRNSIEKFIVYSSNKDSIILFRLTF